jgi:hypothetical protein
MKLPWSRRARPRCSAGRWTALLTFNEDPPKTYVHWAFLVLSFQRKFIDVPVRQNHLFFGHNPRDGHAAFGERWGIGRSDPLRDLTRRSPHISDCIAALSLEVMLVWT